MYCAARKWNWVGLVGARRIGDAHEGVAATGWPPPASLAKVTCRLLRSTMIGKSIPFPHRLPAIAGELVAMLQGDRSSRTYHLAQCFYQLNCG